MWILIIFSPSDLFDSASRRQNKRKLSSASSAHKRQKVDGSSKYRTVNEMNLRIQNKSEKKKQKCLKNGTIQKNRILRRKVFGSKISKKN